MITSNCPVKPQTIHDEDVFFYLDTKRWSSEVKLSYYDIVIRMNLHANNVHKPTSAYKAMGMLITLWACPCVVVHRFFLKKDTKTGGKNTFMCVAAHPKDDCIATGHEDGKIRLW